MSMKLSKFDQYMCAATFAEAGEHETAREFLTPAAKQEPAQSKSPKKKPYGKTLILGAVSLSAYIALFTHQDWVTGAYTEGGWHTLYPVITALFFSFIHGSFGSNLLTVLGMVAKKK